MSQFAETLGEKKEILTQLELAYRHQTGGQPGTSSR